MVDQQWKCKKANVSTVGVYNLKNRKSCVKKSIYKNYVYVFEYSDWFSACVLHTCHMHLVHTVCVHSKAQVKKPHATPLHERKHGRIHCISIYMFLHI